MNPAEIADGVREGMEAEREPVAEKRVLIDEDAELPENPYREHPTITVHGIDVWRGYGEAQQDMLAAGWRKVKEARE